MNLYVLYRALYTYYPFLSTQSRSTEISSALWARQPVSRLPRLSSLNPVYSCCLVVVGPLFILSYLILSFTPCSLSPSSSGRTYQPPLLDRLLHALDPAFVFPILYLIKSSDARLNEGLIKVNNSPYSRLYDRRLVSSAAPGCRWAAAGQGHTVALEFN